MTFINEQFGFILDIPFCWLVSVLYKDNNTYLDVNVKTNVSQIDSGLNRHNVGKV